MRSTPQSSPRPPRFSDDTDRYARCVAASKRVRWENDCDVIRGRSFDFGKKFLPDGRSKLGDLSLPNTDERHFLTWKDVFLFHAREEAQHAILDKLEWQREDEKLTGEEHDRAVGDLIELVAAVDGILVAQSNSDARHFATANARTLSVKQLAQVEAGQNVH